ncbi:MAG: nucleotidyltransferase domain-containing protein [Hydrogenovibrio sp.]|uniref:nucleotidyltransferase domain-containing protein n=1 Tax=Hydrogenovibrio sp. TaxID=2065821 RepID=UPI00286FC902|nr:nucleotidyltransferase domain-containing protein [Hydrogenovibrio sp.]MDR9499718.1 nucleotidyltransferase domain-containing protein [Hydrogenovibrio sp.]
MTEPRQYGLRLSEIEAMQAVLARFTEIETALLYGSRAKGNYKTGSDIDLTLKLKPGVEPSLSLLFAVDEALDDLDLIYTIDLSLFAHIDNPNLIDHIQRVGQVFYQAPADA